MSPKMRFATKCQWRAGNGRAASRAQPSRAQGSHAKRANRAPCSMFGGICLFRSPPSVAELRRRNSLEPNALRQPVARSELAPGAYPFGARPRTQRHAARRLTSRRPRANRTLPEYCTPCASSRWRAKPFRQRRAIAAVIPRRSRCVELPSHPLRAHPRTVSGRGTVPICSEDSANLGQSPTVPCSHPNNS